MAEELWEGLTYFIKPVEGVSPTDRLNQFLEFCRNGERDPVTRRYITDARGYRKVGVFKWLEGFRLCSDVHFFTAEEPALIFSVMLPKNDHPWGEIGGLMDFVETGNLPLQLLAEGQIKLKSRRDMDDAHQGSCRVLDRVPANRIREFTDALKGLPDTDLDDIIDDIENTENINIREFFE